MSRVWDHVHCIPGKILPHFHVRHLSVALLEPELENFQIFRTGTVSRVSNGHVSTREIHMSRVWDHVHCIPGEILPHFHVRHLSVALLEPELENYEIFRTGSGSIINLWRGFVILVNC